RLTVGCRRGVGGRRRRLVSRRGSADNGEPTDVGGRVDRRDGGTWDFACLQQPRPPGPADGCGVTRATRYRGRALSGRTVRRRGTGYGAPWNHGHPRCRHTRLASALDRGRIPEHHVAWMGRRGVDERAPLGPHNEEEESMMNDTFDEALERLRGTGG